jgi:hypothetical protein
MLSAGPRTSTRADFHVSHVKRNLCVRRFFKDRDRHCARMDTPTFVVLRLALPAVAA